MDEPIVTLRALTLVGLLGCVVVVSVVLYSLMNNQTLIVFCTLGQSDGTYIRINNSIDIVINAGSDRKMLDCLGKYMPFFDRTIEFAILTGPQKDMSAGFLPLLDRYHIEKFTINRYVATSTTTQDLLKKVSEKHIPLFIEPRIQPLQIKNLALSFVPFLIINTIPSEQSNPKMSFIKISNHGLKDYLTPAFLPLADNAVIVISCTPCKEVVELLEASHKKYLRTNQGNDIVFRIPR